MGAFLLIGFLVLAIIELWVAWTVLFSDVVKSVVGALYWLVAFVAALGSLYMTGFHSYFANPNTHVHGWPIPRVVFQRDGPDSPWLDFIGPTIILAYPMNFLLFMLVPSVVFMVLAKREQRRARLSAAPVEKV
jgi:hypothetical protein